MYNIRPRRLQFFPFPQKAMHGNVSAGWTKIQWIAPVSPAARTVLISSRSSKSYYMELELKKYFGLYINFSMTIFRLQGLAET